MILIGNVRIQSSATNNLQDSYSFKWWKFNHSVILALQFGGIDLRTQQPVGLHITTANPCRSLGLRFSSILKMIELYCVKLRLYEGEPKAWIMRWWFRVYTKLERLGGQDRAPVDARGIYPGQGQWVILRLYIQFSNQPTQCGLLRHLHHHWLMTLSQSHHPATCTKTDIFGD